MLKQFAIILLVLLPTNCFAQESGITLELKGDLTKNTILNPVVFEHYAVKVFEEKIREEFEEALLDAVSLLNSYKTTGFPFTAVEEGDYATINSTQNGIVLRVFSQEQLSEVTAQLPGSQNLPNDLKFPFKVKAVSQNAITLEDKGTEITIPCQSIYFVQRGTGNLIVH